MNQFFRIAGVDEAGRGPLAGPVVVACVVFKPGTIPLGINDSKKLSAKKRKILYEQILAVAEASAIEVIEPAEIDKINILQATRLGMRKAATKVQELVLQKSTSASIIYLVDGSISMGTNYPEETIIKGDSRIQSIAAASILAKVWRDRLMDNLDKVFPEYEFAKHKGYPTALHLERIRQHGPSSEHRKTFRGVREWLGSTSGLRPTG